MNRLFVVFLLAFTSLPALAQKPIYAEDMERDVQRKNAIYTYADHAGPEYIIFEDREFQIPADCNLGSNSVIEVLSVDTALPTNYVIWNNHAFYIRNHVLDEYYDGTKILKDLSKASNQDLGILFFDVSGAYFDKFIEIEIQQAKENLSAKETQLESLKKYLSENDNASAEVQSYTEELPKEIDQFKNALNTLLDLQEKYLAVISYQKNNISAKKADKFIKDIEEKIHSMDNPDEYFKVFPDKKDEGAVFLTAFLNSSSLERINNYPYEFEIVKNEGEENDLCAVGETYWQLIVSKKINVYGKYTALVDLSKSN